MQPLTMFWMALDPRRKALLVGGVAALLVVFAILSRLATAPSYVLLYSGLEPTAAGEVIAALEARGVAHSVRGDAIFVDQAQRDSLRMALAGEGLPANGAAGYELLDGLSGFGTTSQMFDAAYWRAREGELARTILASPQIRAARVHLATPGNDPFQTPTLVTGSVVVRPASGGISASHAQALRFLVASSVPGLLPDNVTVIDGDSGQIIGGTTGEVSGADADGRAESLRRNIERLLTARVGPGNAVVEVAVELTTARESLLERRIEPDSRVVISTDTEERADSSTDGGGDAVTVASNLPDGDAAGGQGSSAQTSETRERITYDLSETQREVEMAPGGLRRISVAVLLNNVPDVSAEGTPIMVPRDPEEIAALERLVQSAIGFDAARGDQVTVQSMAFEAVPTDLSSLPEGSGLLANLDINRLIQIAILAVVALAIGLGVIRPALRSAALASPGDGPDPLPQGAGGPALRIGADPRSAQVLAGPAGQGALPPGTPGIEGQIDEGRMLAPVAGPAEIAPAFPDPVDRLRRLIEEREEETVEILRGWMEEDAQKP